MIGRSGLLILFGILFIFFLGIFFLLFVQGTKKTDQQFTFKNFDSRDLEKLSDLKIFFGHQSVGENIVAGLERVLETSQGPAFKIVEGKEISDYQSGSFIHSKIGRNTRPESKIRGFAKILSSASPECADIALMKFCYVDLNRASDAAALFESYRTSVSTLQESCPQTVLVHTTVPIESAPKGGKNVIKGWIKRLLGRPTVREDNSVRERYNELVRQTYEGVEPIFDIALIESVGPDGRRSFDGSRSKPIFLMDSRYTSDGGHLNEMGQLLLAEQLLVTLSEAAGRLTDKGEGTEGAP